MRRAPHERLAGVAIHDRSPLAYRRVAGIVQRRAGRGQRLRVERQRRPADPTESLPQSGILKSKLFVFALELHDPAPDLQDPLAEVGVAERVQARSSSISLGNKLGASMGRAPGMWSGTEWSQLAPP
jgi:hypothetical protein